MILTKFAGGALIIVGLAIVVFFPYTFLHQIDFMTNAGIIIGLVVIGIGLFLLSL